MKFQSKLTVFFSIIIVLVATLVTSLVYSNQKKALTEHIQSEIQYKAASIIDKLDAFVFERQADISFLATDPVLLSEPFEPGRITERLVFHRDTYRYYSSLSFFDLGRVRIVDTSGRNLGEQHPATEYWPAIMAGHDGVVVSLSHSESENSTVLHFATMVRDRQDKPTAVLVSRVLLSDLLADIQGALKTQEHHIKERAHPSGHFAAYRCDIVTKQGEPVYSSAGAFAPGHEISTEWKSIEKHLKAGRKSGRFQLAVPEGNGQEVITAFASSTGIHDFPGLGWTAIIHVPTSAALAEVIDLRNSTLIIFALVTLLAVGAIQVFSRTVTRPVGELCRTVSAIGKGDLNARIVVPFDGEFGQLARTINFVADEMEENRKKLLKFNEELSARVIERTGKLKRTNEWLKTELEERQKTQKALQERVLLADFSAAIGMCLSRGKEMNDALQGCAETIVWYLGAAFARIWLLDETGETLVLRASAGMYTHLDGEHSRIPVGKYKIGLIASEREAHLINNVLSDPRVHDQEWARREKIDAFAGYPLLLGDRLVGVLGLFSRTALSEETFEALSSTCDVIALGIRRILSEKDLVKSQEFLNKIINSVADPVFVKDEQHRLVLVNEAFCEFLGYDCADLLHKTDFNLFSAEEAGVFHAKDEEVFRSGRENINEEKITDASGTTHIVITKKTLHVDPRGNRFIVGITRDVTERKKMEEKLREISLRDDLTGLYNRRGFTALAEQQLKVADRKGQATTLSFIDLDDMKGINDRYGHQAGDQALLDTATILRKTFRESDIIGRIGGDEFAVITGDSGAEDAATVLKRLQRHLADHKEQSAAEFSLSLSMGTVDYQAGSALPLEHLMNKADELMYKQKMRKRG